MIGGAANNEDGTTLIRHAQQAARATFPLKKGEGMKEKALVSRYAPRKISPLGQSRLLLPSVEMTKETRSTARKNRAPENRSAARFLGRGGAALQVEHFAIGKMLTA